MKPASTQRTAEHSHLVELTLRGCEVARAAAVAVADGVATSSAEFLKSIKQREEELDILDREINEGVTHAITQVPAMRARELLTCLKFILELERIGDLLLGFANRACSVRARLHPQDTKDLESMAGILVQMLGEDYEAFRQRDANIAVAVLRADVELDRLRNLMLVRHIENPENEPRQESFHLVFMSQFLERAGDHAKNMAEEVVHLVTGRSVRHLLRQQDKPIENMFVDFMRRREQRKRSA